MSVTQNEDKPLTGPWFAFFFFPVTLIELTRFKEGRGRPFELGCFSLEDGGGTGLRRSGLVSSLLRARTGLREVHVLACEEFAEWVKETWGRSGERESHLLNSDGSREFGQFCK